MSAANVAQWLGTHATFSHVGPRSAPPHGRARLTRRHWRAPSPPRPPLAARGPWPLAAPARAGRHSPPREGPRGVATSPVQHHGGLQRREGDGARAGSGGDRLDRGGQRRTDAAAARGRVHKEGGEYREGGVAVPTAAVAAAAAVAVAIAITAGRAVAAVAVGPTTRARRQCPPHDGERVRPRRRQRGRRRAPRRSPPTTRRRPAAATHAPSSGGRWWPWWPIGTQP